MGFYKIEKCIFTGLPVQIKYDDIDAIEYYVKINNKNHFISLSPYATEWEKEEDFFKNNKNLLEGLLLNEDWFEDENTHIEIPKLKELIQSKHFPKTPSEKQESLFLKLSSFQKEDGQLITLKQTYYESSLWKILYFKSINELGYYARSLDDAELIDGVFADYDERTDLLQYKLTINGLNHLIKLQEEGDKSNKCFIAMSFRKETKEIRNAIKSAVAKTGFIPILIDEQMIESERTINDEIIANLKKCRFCIADFSFHSSGVYFESGFALGQGKKVIYTCSKDEFQNAHFDIRPLQHIIYDSPEKLEKDLIHKIEAWIK
jgi:hypothetical protein